MLRRVMKLRYVKVTGYLIIISLITILLLTLEITLMRFALLINRMQLLASISYYSKTIRSVSPSQRSE